MLGERKWLGTMIMERCFPNEKKKEIDSIIVWENTEKH